MPTAHTSHPPLPESGHSHVVQSHVGIDAQDYPTFSADPQTELIILSSNNRRVVAIDAAERLHTDHGITAACLDLANWQIPLEIGQPVVDRLVRIELAATPKDDRNVRSLVKNATSSVQPPLYNFAITVYELD